MAIQIAAADSRLLKSEKLNPKSSWNGSTLFEAIPGPKIGVDIPYPLDLKHPLKRLYAQGWATGNCAIGDVDGDGKLDLFFPGTTTEHKLYLQTDDFQFVDQTAESKVGGKPEIWGSTAIMGDVDRDGDLDIFVANFGSPNQLFINLSRQGKIQFVDMAAEYGVNLNGGSLGASFVDFNGDGWLDLFVQTYHYEPESGRPDKIEVVDQNGVARIKDPLLERSYLAYYDKDKKPQWVEAGLSDVLFINNRKGKLVVPDTGIALGRSYGTAHIWWDLDSDLRADLYTGNDSHGPDLFYRQTSGSRLAEVGRTSIPCSPWFSRGAAAADFNNDLLIDFFATSYAPLTHEARLNYGEPFPGDIVKNLTSGGTRQVARNVLLANTGTTRFEEVARMAGLSYTGATWAVKSGDYDCDGKIDIFLATGEARAVTSLPGRELTGENLKGKTRWDILAQQPANPQPDKAFRNRGGWEFEDAGKQWGLDHNGMSYCASQGDLDGDGDLDLVVNRLNEGVTIYRNHSQEPRVVFDFDGDKSNRDGVGVQMLALIGRQGLLQQLYPTGSFKSADPEAIHVGIGKASGINRVSFRWPGTRTTGTFKNLKPGFRYTVKEGSTSDIPVSNAGRAPLFRGIGSLKNTGYTETPFSTSLAQPMLPQSLANAGPGIAAADLDRDGLSEIYITGSTNIKARFISPTPAILRFKQPFMIADITEETFPLFFDADNDGDLDLFLGDGGLEYGKSDFVLWDRLCLNLGNGQYALAPKGYLPPVKEITSAVAAADYDKDGDVDLYVGCRMRKSNYPQAGQNLLLQNQGKAKFVDAADSVAKGLAGSGMVTGAIWTDTNNDGWLDLLLTHDWGTPQLWLNEKGTLTNATQKSGLANLKGRWNGITGRDIDNDGDIDYLLSNMGTNSGNDATHVYTKNFPDVTAPAIVFAKKENGKMLPTEGWSKWAGIPSIGKKYKTPKNFAAQAKSLFGFDTESKPVATVTEMRTGILINDGAARFTFRPLPQGAQVAPAYGIVLTDFNFDGRCDAFVLHNDAEPTIGTPDPGNGGVSRLFLGTGSTASPFFPLSPDQSGLVMFGSGRAAIVTDLNADHRADLICTMNNSDPVPYINYEPKRRFQPLKVQLDFTGKPVPGARVSVEIPGFPTQTAEYYAGNGYLSQSSSDLFFGAPANPKGPAKISIKWSDGSTTRRTYYFETDLN
ncbi:MAG: FG-GAP-like repeat-containing protein [Verrucomicrobiales bacterium]|nr:FG-GAP-like repeat-containing protein [Verrucomicrobiales bacterium]